MARLIVLEGPDGAGKSTLIQKLSKPLNRPIIHTGGPPKNLKEWSDRLMRLRGYQNGAVLFDRIPHISEQVYGPLYGRDAMDLKTQLTRELFEINPVIIYCRLDKVEDMLRMMSREIKDHKPGSHFDLVISNYFQIVRDYDRIMNELMDGEDLNHRLIVRPYSWQTDSYEDLVRSLDLCAA